MPTNDLSSLPGLADKQRAVLADKLGVTTFYELILADRQQVVEAFGRKSFRPTLEEVAVWQDHARCERAAVAAAADWEQVASFVVVFEQRQAVDGPEHRVQVEQTEVEPEAPPNEWPSWDCGNICGWMLDRLGLPMPARETGHEPVGPGQPPVQRRVSARGRQQLPVERVTLFDMDSRTDLVVDGSLVAQPRTGWVLPARLALVLGASADPQTVAVALQLSRVGHERQIVTGQPGTESRTIGIELPELDSGHYEATVASWAADGSYRPSIIKLPTVLVTESAEPSTAADQLVAEP